VEIKKARRNRRALWERRAKPSLQGIMTRFGAEFRDLENYYAHTPYTPLSKGPKDYSEKSILSDPNQFGPKEEFDKPLPSKPKSK
jgi:hypothetical protein